MRTSSGSMTHLELECLYRHADSVHRFKVGRVLVSFIQSQWSAGSQYPPCHSRHLRFHVEPRFLARVRIRRRRELSGADIAPWQEGH